jgi:hypothetical protein
MKLLNQLGDALLTKLVPGIDARANCGRCNQRSGVGTCTPRCCRNGRQYHAQAVLDQCGRTCGWICWWGLECSSRTC